MHWNRSGLRWAMVSAVVAACTTAGSATSQEASFNVPPSGRPRLVVLIVIDQFPHQYLVEMKHGLAAGGLIRQSIDQGAVFTACRHQHAFTFTGPGHSVMMTGSYPRLSGIVGNTWFDRERKTTVNCVEDRAAPLVGAPTPLPKDGRSPHHQEIPTVGDVLKLATGAKAKVFGVAFKDRAAILTAGNLADAAYWFDSRSGHWITSRHYRAELPAYLESLNESGAVGAYAGRRWELLYGPDKYRMYRPDNSRHEGGTSAFGRAFPHTLPAAVGKDYYEQLRMTPFANELTLRVARMIVQREQLGADDIPDLLCIGLSANDYVGHYFGPYSLEVQDMTYRTDQALANFTGFLTESLGDRWSLVVSSDHGVAPIPEYAAELGLSATRDPLGRLDDFTVALEKALRERLGARLDGENYVQHVTAEQVYLNTATSGLSGERRAAAERILRDELLQHPAVAACFTREQLLGPTGSAPGGAQDILGQFRLTFHQQRSGDVLFALSPYHMQLQRMRTTHGTPWEYDRHVLLLLLGRGIRSGTYTASVSPAQIAPTLSHLLSIAYPPGCSVEPLHDALEGWGTR